MGDSSSFYDWHRTFSYNADVTMVITARGRGKTYGLRRACLDDFLAHGYRFVEVCRYKEELSQVMAGYFDRLALIDAERYKGIEFKVEGRKGMVRREGDKAWETACYFVALTEAQNAKKRTYNAVRRIIFDEALIEHGTYLRYIPREFQTLINLVDTVTREVAGVTKVRPHLYLLSNACDITNPYFAAMGVDRVPEFGYTWYMHKTFLLHYEEPGEYAERKAVGTLAGRMAAMTDEATTAIGNLFNFGASDDIQKKTSGAAFWCGIVYQGEKFGIWVDYEEGYYYVTRKFPKDAARVYSLTRHDNTANRLVAHRATPAMRALVEAHYDRIIRYDSIATREKLLDALSMFGVR